MDVSMKPLLLLAFCLSAYAAEPCTDKNVGSQSSDGKKVCDYYVPTARTLADYGMAGYQPTWFVLGPCDKTHRYKEFHGFTCAPVEDHYEWTKVSDQWGYGQRPQTATCADIHEALGIDCPEYKSENPKIECGPDANPESVVNHDGTLSTFCVPAAQRSPSEIEKAAFMCGTKAIMSALLSVMEPGDPVIPELLEIHRRLRLREKAA